MRDRLIELLKTMNLAPEITCPRFNKQECKGCQFDKGNACDILARETDYLIENGVIVLPCKVGDEVYTNFAMQGWYYRDKDRPYSAKIVFIGLNNSEEMGGGLINVLFKKNGNMMQFNFSDIGKTVFLTKEEAEQALKGGEG